MANNSHAPLANEQQSLINSMKGPVLITLALESSWGFNGPVMGEAI
jgi:hypothetical protein